MNTMNKRQALLTLAALGLASATAAQASEDQPLSANRILKSLDRDIVLDRPPAGSAGTANAPAPKPIQPHLDLYVQFAFNSAELLPAGRKQLDELGKALNNRSLLKWGFELAGHTDAVGGVDYNMQLSLERANAVKHYLVTRHGLNAERLVPLGFGFSRLANPAQPTAAVNRRVEVRRVALANGRAATLPPSPSPSAQPASGGRLVSTP